MRRKMVYICALFFVAAFLSSFSAHAQLSPQETLNQYISDLQKNPSDNALREKIIKLVQEMGQKPAIPESAREHFGKKIWGQIFILDFISILI